MRTVLYLLRHGATAANLADPPRLQGRRQDPALAPLGVRQAELTRDFLAIRAIDHVYTSPLLRAVQTAEIIAAPHGLTPAVRAEFIECDIGRWEGMDWESIRKQDADSYQKFMADPAAFGYPEGESFAEVYERAGRVLEDLLERHAGATLLVVSHHVVNRTYLATLLGLGVNQARRVRLDNCGISVIEREGERATVTTLNAAFHLQGAAA
jgi:broad specificity phosphatase PhoE